jgi:hypothetical protein
MDHLETGFRNAATAPSSAMNLRFGRLVSAAVLLLLGTLVHAQTPPKGPSSDTLALTFGVYQTDTAAVM